MEKSITDNTIINQGYSPQNVNDSITNTMQYLDAVIFSSTPDGLRYHFITAGIKKILGVSSEEAVANPKKLMHMIVPEDFPIFRELVNKVRSRESGTVEYRMHHTSGALLYIRHTAYPVFEGDKLVRIDGIVYNITGEIESRVQLQKSQEKLRGIIETADDLIFTLDKQGSFVSINNSGAMHLEYLPFEINGKHFLEFVSDESKSTIARSFQEILKTKNKVAFDAVFKSKYGKTIVFEINARAIFEGAVLDGVLGIGRNITVRRTEQEKVKELNNKLIEANRIISIERDRAKQKISILEELNRLKNEFVSNISHELRTPLASIIGFAETIDSDRDMPNEMKTEFNQIIMTEAKRLSKLINDVLDISRIEEGKISLVKAEFSIQEILEPLLEQYKKKIEDKGIVFWAELPKQKVYLLGDKARILQVFENILSNSLKFTNEGRITLLAQTLYREFELIITDTGIGIPKKDLPYIFQKFYRVSRPGSEIPGTGLGLAFVKQIVDLHKGFITIQSEDQKGTTVVIKFPIIKQD
ncbi:MAG: PAS domain S-box protein [Ignavibacteriales bacterium]|nr:PAS domain S-box protein [Ignavibacteriales bacterium]